MSAGTAANDGSSAAEPAAGDAAASAPRFWEDRLRWRVAGTPGSNCGWHGCCALPAAVLCIFLSPSAPANTIHISKNAPYTPCASAEAKK